MSEYYFIGGPWDKQYHQGTGNPNVKVTAIERDKFQYGEWTVKTVVYEYQMIDGIYYARK